jgi:hypothetical protein
MIREIDSYVGNILSIGPGQIIDANFLIFKDFNDLTWAIIRALNEFRQSGNIFSTIKQTSRHCIRRRDSRNRLVRWRHFV